MTTTSQWNLGLHHNDEARISLKSSDDFKTSTFEMSGNQCDKFSLSTVLTRRSS
jgi:hypothetical protein